MARRTLAQRVNKLPAKLIARTGISPNVITVLGFLVACTVAWVLATGHFFLGGFLILFSGVFDMLDGAVARVSGKTTRFGSLLDSTLDRFSEGVLFVGLLAYYADRNSYQEVLLIGAALIGSMMTSYVRARAEGLGLKCEVGLFTRPERMILLSIGLIFNQMLVILWIIAVLANFVALQRLLYVRQQLGNEARNSD
ncbi:MAG: CDP-alcohol phosphatidyltransferase family protein [Dehalococcoidia bacterium]|nr:MAG: CDP-alcohol phosphatidyltransferase family protein [Dehalococcoidia bacterium]UCG84592.1 MAG: CDP-alcohol phosphatidyltransferase family protein [Dehalococcoidia bacterium]